MTYKDNDIGRQGTRKNENEWMRTARAARRGREGANGLQWGGLGAWAKGTVIGEWCDNGEGGMGSGVNEGLRGRREG